jgi:BTB And C-terminal Kelch
VPNFKPNYHLGLKSIGTVFFQYLVKNSDACLRRERFLSCTQSTLLAMLKLPHLEVSCELQVLLAVVRWAKFQNHGLPLDPFISQRLLGPCLQHIRFLALTPTQFSEHVAKSGLLSIEDCLVVLVNLNSPGQMPLPPHLCRDASKRSDGNSGPEQHAPPPMKRQVSFESANKPMTKPAAEVNKVAEKMQKEPKKEEANCQGTKKDVKIEEKPKPIPAPKW